MIFITIYECFLTSMPAHLPSLMTEQTIVHRLASKVLLISGL